MFSKYIFYYVFVCLLKKYTKSFSSWFITFSFTTVRINDYISINGLLKPIPMRNTINPQTFVTNARKVSKQNKTISPRTSSLPCPKYFYSNEPRNGGRQFPARKSSLWVRKYHLLIDDAASATAFDTLLRHTVLTRRDAGCSRLRTAAV